MINIYTFWKIKISKYTNDNANELISNIYLPLSL